MPTTSAASSHQGPQGPLGPFGPIDIALQADIRAPVEVVWNLLVDWENMGRWMREASDFRVTTGHREGAGVEVEAKVRIGGITTTDTVRVTRWEPPHVLAADHLGWVKGDAIMQCIPTDRGTRLEWVERLVPPLGPVGGIGIRLFKPLMVRVFVRDLSLLKRLAETQAGTRKPRPSPGPGAGAGLDPARTARPAKASSTARRRVRGPEDGALFARWFWLVYLPLTLMAAVLVLTVADLMPAGLRVPLLVVVGVWSALALFLLFERRRRRVAVRAPRRIVLGIGAVALTAGAGALLTWIGIGKVSSSEGLAMLLVGCFFLLMAVFTPMFKLVDSALRLVARFLTRRSRSPEQAYPEPSARATTAMPTAEGTTATSSQPYSSRGS
jgi:uncharacterized protein YndB with AHSA1/START domain